MRQSFVVKVLRYTGISCRKRQVPITHEETKRTNRSVRKLAKTLTRLSRDVKVVMNDESYLTFSHSKTPVNSGYHVSMPWYPTSRRAKKSSSHRREWCGSPSAKQASPTPFSRQARRLWTKKRVPEELQLWWPRSVPSEASLWRSAHLVFRLGVLSCLVNARTAR